MNINELLTGKINEGKRQSEPEVDWSVWDEKIARLKRLAKAGPLKTVWDPVKRVYKNVPAGELEKKTSNGQG